MGLEEDPDERPTARDAINHSWLREVSAATGEADGPEDVSIDVLRQLQDFASQSALRRAACGVMAFSMSPHDVQQVEREFRSLDINGNGVITVNELTSVLKRRLRLTDEQARHIFERLDQTGNDDQEIQYSEFLAAAVVSRSILHKNAIREAFDKFDIDGKGFIAIGDLQRVLGDEYGGVRVSDILSAADSSKTGTIEYHEFVEALRERPLGTDVPLAADVDLIRRASRRTLGRITRFRRWS